MLSVSTQSRILALRPKVSSLHNAPETISLSETKSIHHSWINEEIEVSGYIDSDEWLITREHVNHRTKRLRYSIEWEPVVDSKTGEIYVEYNLFSTH